MAINLTQGRQRGCKDNSGGVKKVYIFPFEYANRSEITHSNFTLVNFPVTTSVYEFIPSNNATMEITQQEDERGKYYKQSINLEFAKTSADQEFMKFLRKDLRCIVKDSNGLNWLLGAYNGLFCNKLEAVTGDKKNSFNGYKLTLEGEELNEPFFLTDEYIDDNLLTNYLLAQNKDFLTFQNGDNIITQDG